MPRIFKLVIASVVALFALTSVTACAPATSLDMSTVAAIIDVRTPVEFAEGHLHDALNIDIQGASFGSEIGALDKTANYVIYCRSGNRAGQAVTYMQENGFTGTLTNAGGVDAASSLTGMPIVK